MLAYDLDFALLMRHEYHRRDTRTVVGGFLHVSQSQGSISNFDEQSMVLLLKLCETEEERILFLLLPYYHWYPFQNPWLCKLQRNKHELPVNTPSPNTHRFLVLQISPLPSERRQYIFFIVPPQYYWPLLHVCRFLYSLNKRSQARQFVFKHTWSSCEDFKVPQD